MREMLKIYSRAIKLLMEITRIKLIGLNILLILPILGFSQEDSLALRPQFISISIDSARKIQYNQKTTAEEVVIRNILGIVEKSPRYFIEQVNFDEYIAHYKAIHYDSLSSFDSIFTDNFSLKDFIICKFYLYVILYQEEFRETYLISDKIQFSYRKIGLGRGFGAIVIVNDEKIYLLRRVGLIWKIYNWTSLDMYRGQKLCEDP